MELSEPTQSMLQEDMQIQTQIHHKVINEEEYWCLKSRSLWLKSGDKNTKFFQNQAKSRIS